MTKHHTFYCHMCLLSPLIKCILIDINKNQEQYIIKHKSITLRLVLVVSPKSQLMFLFLQVMNLCFFLGHILLIDLSSASRYFLCFRVLGVLVCCFRCFICLVIPRCPCWMHQIRVHLKLVFLKTHKYNLIFCYNIGHFLFI